MEKGSITQKSISVIVQGIIDPVNTQKCLRAIRNHLPDSEIILSTWKGSDVSRLDYDILVLNEDPGASNYDAIRSAKNNINRQLLSTQGGIAKASGKFILKLRSDLILESSAFLFYFDKFSAYDPAFHILTRRLMVPSLFSRFFSDETGRPTPFHLSDWWFFGLAEDMRTYFGETPLVDIEEYSRYKRLRYPSRRPYRDAFFRYTPEQYFCYSFFKRHIPELRFDDWTDFTDENIEWSEKVIANNFIILDPWQHEITNPKYTGISPYKIRGIINFGKFFEYYQKHAVSSQKGIDRLGDTELSMLKLFTITEKALAKQRQNYELSTSYRIGRAVSWLPRQFYCFYRGCKRYGICIAVKLSLKKILAFVNDHSVYYA
jgi:hypothetical protein